ncbi:capsular exopolysaccharide family protein [Listeria floridensis FSL S10-1187]|uniref:non-specific protein-tyrosine kinase n=1 Tax=Listeria floridensis FSL S10-1187 TaxID=1265817 RepID=A0ABN0RC27_9LIST|nr:CpsD/CapB family tyrosine-protein kinase [Listeria floridensis]EUJ26124.1 capsular exopolysaccharide family protein [Listeria floridensis FSL S10-1187]
MAKRTKPITFTNPDSVVAEQIRTIRTNISFFKVDKRELKVLLITSPEAGSGKSTISANLAISFAQQGKRTLLIDADLRKPTVHRTFLGGPVDGLSAVLTQEVSLKEGIRKTEIDHLFVLASGTRPPNPNELLGTNAMKLVLREAAEQFDQIVIDTPPATIVSDALVLASEADGVILVCRAAKTLRESAKLALKQMQLAETPIVGCVLNGIKNRDQYVY